MYHFIHNFKNLNFIIILKLTIIYYLVIGNLFSNFLILYSFLKLLKIGCINYILNLVFILHHYFSDS